MGVIRFGSAIANLVPDGVLPKGAIFQKGGPAELDKSIYKCQCETSTIKSRAPQPGRADPNYTGLYCVGFDLTGQDGPMSYIDLFYEGCLNNVRPQNMTSLSTVLQSASCTSDNETVEIQYYTSAFSVTGITGPDDVLTIEATGTPKIISARGPFDNVEALLAFFTLESFVQRTKEELVPGHWYRETATVTPTYIANL